MGAASPQLLCALSRALQGFAAFFPTVLYILYLKLSHLILVFVYEMEVPTDHSKADITRRSQRYRGIVDYTGSVATAKEANDTALVYRLIEFGSLKLVSAACLGFIVAAVLPVPQLRSAGGKRTTLRFGIRSLY